jgi:hypothetical protein
MGRGTWSFSTEDNQIGDDDGVVLSSEELSKEEEDSGL